MEKIELVFDVVKPFGNLFRKKHVLVAVQDDAGNVLVGAKTNFYPPTILRLLGGGVDGNETFEQAAVREIKEEANVDIDAGSLIPLVIFVATAKDGDGKEYNNETAIFAVNIGAQPYQAGDDVTEIVCLTPDELHELGARYEQLHETLWYKSKDYSHAWADYAKLYGPVHKVAAKKIKALS